MSIWFLSNKRLFTFICILVGLGYTLTFTGCATIMHGRHQDIGIASTPSGATAKVDGTTVITPSTLHLKRNRSYSVQIEKEGYEPGGATFTSHLSGWLWGNVFFGGLVGLLVDFITGGAKKITPDNTAVTLVKKIDEQGVSGIDKEPFKEKIGTGSLTNIEKELEKLEKMKKDGKINEQEYKRMREKLIEKY